MFFKKNNRKVLGFGLLSIMFLLMIVYSVELADAATVKVGQDDNKTYVCFNRETGVFTEAASSANECKKQGYGQSSVKIINNDYAYCVNWKLKYKSDSKYEVVDSWKDTNENAIKAGFLINYIQKVNNKGYDKNKAYSNAAATLNTLFATKENDSGSYDFSSNSEFSGYLNEADKYYKSIKNHMTYDLPKPTISVDGGTVLSYNDTTKKYFSGKVTIANLKPTYGGDNDVVTYTLSAKVGSDSVSICSDVKGVDCKAGDVPISGKNTYSFYIFVDKTSVNEGASIIVNIKGSNKSTYYSSVLYDDTTYDYTQKLITMKEINYPRSTNRSETLLVPVLSNHTINAYKVDENGEEICGATLEIYRDDPKGENINNRIATNTDDDDGGDDCRITYISDKVIEEDDFFEHDYYLIERSAPDGFVLSDSVRHFKPKDELSLGCYTTVNGELVEADDPEYCYPENYAYMCKNNTDPTKIKEPVNGNCPFTDSENDGGISTNAIPDGSVELNSAYSKVCYNIKDENKLDEVDNSYCNSSENYTKIWNGYGNITVRQLNVRNVVNISKMDITNKKEVVGAKLKVCTKASYDEKGNECDVALNYDGVAMSWVSDDVPHSIYGIKVGEYYIIETTPPKGYLQATTTVKFSIDEYGKVTTDDKTITNADFVNNGSVVVVDNDLSEITISKQDMSTSKELPGATLSICHTYDENGEIQMLVDQYSGDCIEAVLYNGEIATWKSTNKPKEIKGLEPGTYYLVERIAPTDYSTAESILFTLKSDGTLVDKDGELLSDNKLIMKDEPIEDKNLGSFSTYVVVGIVLFTLVLGIGSYHYLNKRTKNMAGDKVDDVFDKKKVRKRKIYNKK